MDLGRDPRKGIILLLGSIVSWLLAMALYPQFSNNRCEPSCPT